MHVSIRPASALGRSCLGISLSLVDSIEAHTILGIHHVRVIKVARSLILDHYFRSQEVLLRVTHCCIIALVGLHRLTVHIDRGLVRAIARFTIDTFQFIYKLVLKFVYVVSVKLELVINEFSWDVGESILEHGLPPECGASPGDVG